MHCPPISHVSVLEAQEMQMQSAVSVELVDSLHVLKVWALKISLDLCLMRKAGLMGKSRKKIKTTKCTICNLHLLHTGY